MNIVVPVRLVPDLVEEIDISDDGKSLDRTFMRMMVNEFDDHAIEEAILLKKRAGGTVTIIGLASDELEDVLYTGAAKGADRLIKLDYGDEAEINNHSYAKILKEHIVALNPDLVLTGVSAHDQFDGPLGALLAESLGWTYLGYISEVEVAGGTCSVSKEFPGGLIVQYEIGMPAVLGIQAAEEPPQYVAISKIRQAMKTAEIETLELGQLELVPGPSVENLYKPEAGDKAEMLDGDELEVAEKLIKILQERGVI